MDEPLALRFLSDPGGREGGREGARRTARAAVFPGWGTGWGVPFLEEDWGEEA